MREFADAHDASISLAHCPQRQFHILAAQTQLEAGRFEGVIEIVFAPYVFRR